MRHNVTILAVVGLISVGFHVFARYIRRRARRSAGLLAIPILAVALAAGATPAPASASSSPASVYRWGSYSGTKPANADLTMSPAPVAIPDSSPVAQVATSNSSGYALLADGTVWAWGGGGGGELGDGLRKFSATPVQVQFPAGVSIAWLPTDVMPFDTGLAVDTAGNVWGWGDNEYGELCLGNTHSYTTPVKLPFTDVTALAGAGAHALYDAAGTVYACGAGRDGELGDNSETSTTTPVAVSGIDGSQVTALTASYSNSGALLANGTYLDWGYNADGQLGDGTTTDSDIPVPVTLPGTVAQVALGGDLFGNGQTLVLLGDGSMWGWGDDSHGQLGDGQTTAEPSPIAVALPPGVVTVAALATSGTTSYVVSADGGVWAWGNGIYGQIGDGTTQTAMQPVKVASGAQWISATAHSVVIGSP